MNHDRCNQNTRSYNRPDIKNTKACSEYVPSRQDICTVLSDRREVSMETSGRYDDAHLSEFWQGKFGVLSPSAPFVTRKGLVRNDIPFWMADGRLGVLTNQVHQRGRELKLFDVPMDTGALHPLNTLNIVDEHRVLFHFITNVALPFVEHMSAITKFVAWNRALQIHFTTVKSNPSDFEQAPEGQETNVGVIQTIQSMATLSRYQKSTEIVPSQDLYSRDISEFQLSLNTSETWTRALALFVTLAVQATYVAPDYINSTKPKDPLMMYTNLLNVLNKDDQSTLSTLVDRLYEAAKTSRVSFEPVGAMFATVGLASWLKNVNQTETARMIMDALHIPQIASWLQPLSDEDKSAIEERMRHSLSGWVSNVKLRLATDRSTYPGERFGLLDSLVSITQNPSFFVASLATDRPDKNPNRSRVIAGLVDAKTSSLWNLTIADLFTAKNGRGAGALSDFFDDSTGYPYRGYGASYPYAFNGIPFYTFNDYLMAANKTCTGFDLKYLSKVREILVNSATKSKAVFDDDIVSALVYAITALSLQWPDAVTRAYVHTILAAMGDKIDDRPARSSSNAETTNPANVNIRRTRHTFQSAKLTLTTGVKHSRDKVTRQPRQQVNLELDAVEAESQISVDSNGGDDGDSPDQYTTAAHDTQPVQTSDDAYADNVYDDTLPQLHDILDNFFRKRDMMQVAMTVISSTNGGSLETAYESVPALPAKLTALIRMLPFNTSVLASCENAGYGLLDFVVYQLGEHITGSAIVVNGDTPCVETVYSNAKEVREDTNAERVKQTHIVYGGAYVPMPGRMTFVPRAEFKSISSGVDQEIVTPMGDRYGRTKTPWSAQFANKYTGDAKKYVGSILPLPVFPSEARAVLRSPAIPLLGEFKSHVTGLGSPFSITGNFIKERTRANAVLIEELILLKDENSAITRATLTPILTNVVLPGHAGSKMGTINRRMCNIDP